MIKFVITATSDGGPVDSTQSSVAWFVYGDFFLVAADERSAVCEDVDDMTPGGQREHDGHG